MHPAFGGFINDPTAQMGLKLGQNMAQAGQDYVEQNVCHIREEGHGRILWN